MLNFTELSTHISYILRNRGDISTMVGQWINQAYRDVWNELPVHTKEELATVALTADQNYVAVPSGTYAVQDVRYIDDTDDSETHLHRFPLRELNLVDIETENPTYYDVYGGNIYFDTNIPSSSDTLRILRIKAANTLSGTTTPSIPDDFESALISFAAAYGFRSCREMELAAQWLAIGKQQLATAMHIYDHEVMDYQIGLGVKFDD